MIHLAIILTLLTFPPQSPASQLDLACVQRWEPSCAEYACVAPSPTPSPEAHVLPRLYSDKKEEVCRKQVAYSIVKQHNVQVFGEAQWDALEKLICSESTFNHLSKNGDSGACGPFQFAPCQKMQCELTDIDCQVRAGLSYIKRRYGTPAKAYAFWLSRQPIGGKDIGYWY